MLKVLLALLLLASSCADDDSDNKSQKDGPFAGQDYWYFNADANVGFLVQLITGAQYDVTMMYLDTSNPLLIETESGSYALDGKGGAIFSPLSTTCPNEEDAFTPATAKIDMLNLTVESDDATTVILDAFSSSATASERPASGFSFQTGCLEGEEEAAVWVPRKAVDSAGQPR